MSTLLDLGHCVLCERQATARCSGCKRMRFCGPQCQKTVWAVHKALCSADPDVFRQAPLSQTELADFRECGNTPYPEPPGSVQDIMPFKDAFQKPGQAEGEGWEELLELLQAPIPSAGTPRDDEDDMDAAGLREDMLIMARIRLCILYDYGNSDLRYPPESLPWLEMAELLSSISACYQDASAETATGPEVHHELYKGKTAQDIGPWVPLILLARDRGLAEIDRAPLSSERIRKDVRRLMEGKYDEMREFGVGPDGRMRPAVHP